MKTVLNLGSGPPRRKPGPCHWSFPLDEWREVRVDIEPRYEPDLLGTMTDLSAVASASVDAVFSAHSLEHLYPHEAPVALAEAMRVLVPGGGFLCHMPDLAQACAAVAEGREEQFLYQAPGGPIAALDMLFGYRRRLAIEPGMAHRWGYTAETLRVVLEGAGFEGVNVWVEQYDLWGVGYKKGDA